jgi:uncharacterized RDD family membrane protein YckC
MPCPVHPAVERGLDRCERCGGIFCPDCFVVLRDAPYCASCKVEHIRDLRSGLEPGALDLGSVGRRFAALWLDGFLTGMASYALLIPLMVLIVGAGAASAPDQSDVMTPVLSLLFYAFALGIPFVYEGWMLSARGQTLGKMALGVKVVTPEGHDISRGQAWGRTALKVVLAFCVGITYIPAFMTRERTTLHDMMARTRVVRVSR